MGEIRKLFGFELRSDDNRLLRLGRGIGARLVPRPQLPNERQAKQRERVLKAAQAVAEGPNRIALGIIAASAALPLVEQQEPSPVEGRSHTGTVMDKRSDEWTVWLATADAETAVLSKTRLVPNLGNLSFSMPNSKLKAQDLSVKALTLKTAVESNPQGYVERPTTTMYCHIGTLTYGIGSANRLTLKVDDVGNLHDTTLRIKAGMREMPVDVDRKSLDNMLLDASLAVASMTEMYRLTQNNPVDDGVIGEQF